MVSSAHPNKINSMMRSVVRQLQQKRPHTKEHYRQSLREPLSRITERIEGKRDTFSDARIGSKKGVTLENSIKRLSISPRVISSERPPAKMGMETC